MNILFIWRFRKITFNNKSYRGVNGVMVSIAAFQAVVLGSIPGWRRYIFANVITTILNKYGPYPFYFWKSDFLIILDKYISFLVLFQKITFDNKYCRSVNGVMVSIAAFQAVVPGSIPGWRSYFLQKVITIILDM